MQGLEGFSSKVYQKFKEEITPILLNSSYISSYPDIKTKDIIKNKTKDQDHICMQKKALANSANQT